MKGKKTQQRKDAQSCYFTRTGDLSFVAECGQCAVPCLPCADKSQSPETARIYMHSVRGELHVLALDQESKLTADLLYST